MWIAAIQLTVKTKDERWAGTDDLIQADFLRDGHLLGTLDLNIVGAFDDNERGDEGTYTLSDPADLPRTPDETVELQQGVTEEPMPYPPYGFEFSNGMEGHLRIRLKTDGSDMWIPEKLELEIKQFRLVRTASSPRDWGVDPSWDSIKIWNFMDGPGSRPLSLDNSEGNPYRFLAV